MKDPKIGYHVIWVVPLIYTVAGVASVYNKLHDNVDSVKKTIARKKRLKDPKIAELSRLSGIKS